MLIMTRNIYTISACFYDYLTGAWTRNTQLLRDWNHETWWKLTSSNHRITIYELVKSSRTTCLRMIKWRPRWGEIHPSSAQRVVSCWGISLWILTGHVLQSTVIVATPVAGEQSLHGPYSLTSSPPVIFSRSRCLTVSMDHRYMTLISCSNGHNKHNIVLLWLWRYMETFFALKVWAMFSPAFLDAVRVILYRCNKFGTLVLKTTLKTYVRALSLPANYIVERYFWPFTVWKHRTLRKNVCLSHTVVPINSLREIAYCYTAHLPPKSTWSASDIDTGEVNSEGQTRHN